MKKIITASHRKNRKAESLKILFITTKTSQSSYQNKAFSQAASASKRRELSRLGAPRLRCRQLTAISGHSSNLTGTPPLGGNVFRSVNTCRLKAAFLQQRIQS